MNSQTFDLRAAQTLWRTSGKWLLFFAIAPGAVFLLGAAGALFNPREPYGVRVEISVVFVVAALFSFVWLWTPLRPNYKARRPPTRLLLDDEGIRLELAGGSPVALPWNDPKFRVDLYVWPSPRAGRPPYTVDISPYAAVPLESAPHEALQTALELHRFAKQVTLYRLPFGQKGTVRRATYQQSPSGSMSGLTGP